MEASRLLEVGKGAGSRRRSLTVPSSTILTSAFLTAALANLLFFTGLGSFVLLPLHSDASARRTVSSG
jgi:hypothetical protein